MPYTATNVDAKSIPWRDFYNFTVHNFKGDDPDSHNYQYASDWANERYIGDVRIGEKCYGTQAAGYNKALLIFRLEDEDVYIDGLDHILLFENELIWAGEKSVDVNSGNLDAYCVHPGESAFDWDRLTGRFKDGLAVEYDQYAPFGPPSWVVLSVRDGDLDLYVDEFDHFVFQAYSSGAGGYFWEIQEDTFGGTNGHLKYDFSDYDPQLNATNEEFWGSLQPVRVRLFYFNSVVHSFSKYKVRAKAEETIYLYGSNFNIPTALLKLLAHVPTGAWNHRAVNIYLEGREGQGTYTLALGGGADFDIVSNTELRVRLPKLKAGSYEVKIKTTEQDSSMVCYSYAGDWKVDFEGRASQSERLILWAFEDDPVEPDEPDEPVVPGIEFANIYFSEIDIAGLDKFWDGRILNMASLKRAVDDKSGLDTVSDMQITLANNDKFFSQLLYSESTIKNSICNIYRIFPTEGTVPKTSILKMIIDDYELQGDKFILSLKDITQMYFRKKVPFDICTIEEFPNLFEPHIGRAKPELIGLGSLKAEPFGAAEAIYVNTASYSYMASNRMLYSVDEVYSDGELMTVTTDYSIEHRDGQTHIVFVEDQEQNKITFNFKGYTDFGRNSPNGYVQNPAYVLLYYIQYIMKFPDTMIDFESFYDLADIYEAISQDESAYLIMQDTGDPKTYLQELCFSFGCSIFKNKDGQLSVDRKDVSNYDTDFYLFEQIHALSNSRKPFNLRETVNYSKAKFKSFPTANLFLGLTEYTYEKSIEDFNTEIEPDSPFQFPWINTESFAYLRTQEELLRKGYGDKKIYFEIPLHLFSEVELLQNFRYVDPFGISPDGSGEAGRYYYIESLEYLWHENKIDVSGVDLQWLAGQVGRVGKQADLERDWADASVEQRFYLYVGSCLTGAFPDGEPNKKVGKC